MADFVLQASRYGYGGRELGLYGPISRANQHACLNQILNLLKLVFPSQWYRLEYKLIDVYAPIFSMTLIHEHHCYILEFIIINYSVDLLQSAAAR